MAMTETDRIISSINGQIDAMAAGIQTRISDVIARVDKINGSVNTALIDAATARVIADENKLKIGTIHENTKTLRDEFLKVAAAAKEVSKRDGASVRRRDVWLVVAAAGGVIAILRFLGVLHAVTW